MYNGLSQFIVSNQKEESISMQWKIKQLRVNAVETRLGVTGAFVLNMLKVRRHSAFDANPKRLLAMPLRCCRDACDHTVRTSAFCIFLGRRGIAVRALLWCYRGFKV